MAESSDPNPGGERTPAGPLGEPRAAAFDPDDETVMAPVGGAAKTDGWDITQDATQETGTTPSAAKGSGSTARLLGPAAPIAFQNRFPLGALLGKGGMAQVFRAEDRTLHRYVAIKRLLTVQGLRSGKGEIRLRRFLREAQVTAQLDHPNVVPIYAIEKDGDGTPALVMKCIEGLTLKEFLDQCRGAWGENGWSHERHGLPARIEILLKICDAVAFAHSRGVLHLDLKPANVMIGAFGEVYVMDWGIARVLTPSATGGPETDDPQTDEPATDVDPPPPKADHPDPTPDTDGDSANPPPGDAGAKPIIDSSGVETGAGGVLGTPLYMPPEQLIDRATRVGPAADQFALGMMLHEILVLAQPRPKEPIGEVLQLAQEGRRLPFPQGRGGPRAPAALEAVTARATAKDPADRYASVEALAAELRRYQRGEELEAYPDNLVRRFWRRVEQHPVRAMATVLILVTLGAVTSIFNLRRNLELSEQNLELSAEKLAMARQHEIELQVLSQLVSTVTEFSYQQDKLAAQLERMVEALAVEVENTLNLDTESGGSGQGLRVPVLPPAAVRGTGTQDPRYAQPTRFDAVVALQAEGADQDLARNQLDLLAGRSEIFPFIMFRTLDTPPEGPLGPETLRVIAADSRVAYAYVGFDSGLMVNYPAVANWPANYDPRARPWFRGAPKDRSTGWNRYQDATGSGALIPCVRRIYDRQGDPMGVVAIDVFQDALIRNMKGLSIPGRKDLWMVELDREGQASIVVQLADLGADGAVPQGPRAGRPEPPAELVTRLREAPENGIYATDEELMVFCRTDLLGWYLVAVLDRSVAFRALEPRATAGQRARNG